MKVDILYEDNHLLVVNKPVNIPVQGDASKDKALLDVLKEDIKVRYNKPGNVFLALVHRLDRPVGGAMVFAKTSKAASRLSDVLRRKKMQRSYVAVIRGQMPHQGGKLVHYLYKNNQENKVYVAKASDKRAKKAIATYETLQVKEGFSLVRVELETGRSHQIRIQLHASGCPIFGDQKYGAQVNKPGEQIALWSHRLAFPHPTKDEMVEVYSIPPQVYPWDVWDKALLKE